MRRLADPSKGYDLRLSKMVSHLFPVCVKNRVKVVGNMGAANPEAATEVIVRSLRGFDYKQVRVGTIVGDDVLEWVKREDPVIAETGRPLSALQGEVVSANAYIGADPIIEALHEGADIVVGGRIADPSLFLAPLMYEFGWGQNDWEYKGRGQLVGHLLECGAHVTGGNFADPPYRIVPDLAQVPFPLAEVNPEGEMILSKLPNTGGVIDILNTKAQLIWEIHDPANYLTPDVTVDLSEVQVEQVGPNRVRVWGAHGKPWPQKLKVLVGTLEGYIGEGEITFAGPGAYERAKLGAEVVQERIRIEEVPFEELRVDFIGLNSVHGSASPNGPIPYEIRLRVAGRTRDQEAAEWLAHEVEYLYFGPASGGGVRRYVRQVLALYTTYIPRDQVKIDVRIQET